MNLNPNVSGRFILEAVKPDGSRRQLADFENLITDGGLNRLGTDYIVSHAQVGSGSTAPSNSDTSLASRVAGTSTASPVAATYGCQASAPYFGWARKIFRFAAGQATGNLSEVGVGWSSAGDLFSRALIKDGSGNPTTITILADEVLDVTYELRLYPPLVDQAFDIVLGGVTYACLMRAAQVTNPDNWTPRLLLDYGTSNAVGWYATAYDGDIGTITQNPSGTFVGSVLTTRDAYSNNSLVREFHSNFGLADAVGSIKSIVLQIGSGGWQQCSFTPPIPKTNDKILNLHWRLAWARKA